MDIWDPSRSRWSQPAACYFGGMSLVHFHDLGQVAIHYAFCKWSPMPWCMVVPHGPPACQLLPASLESLSHFHQSLHEPPCTSILLLFGGLGVLGKWVCASALLSAPALTSGERVPSSSLSSDTIQFFLEHLCPKSGSTQISDFKIIFHSSWSLDFKLLLLFSSRTQGGLSLLMTMLQMYTGCPRQVSSLGLGRAFLLVKGPLSPCQDWTHSFLGWEDEAPGRMEHWFDLGLWSKGKLRPALESAGGE